MNENNRRQAEKVSRWARDLQAAGFRRGPQADTSSDGARYFYRFTMWIGTGKSATMVTQMNEGLIFSAYLHHQDQPSRVK